MSIRTDVLDEAIAEAKRFIEAAERVRKSAGKLDYGPGRAWYEGGAHCAAAKRASMDLSRKLTEVRRGRAWDALN